MCPGTSFSVSTFVSEITPSNKITQYAPDAVSFRVFNNSSSDIDISGMIVKAGGTICYPEMQGGCYSGTYNIKFSNPAGTGSVLLEKFTKAPANACNTR